MLNQPNPPKCEVLILTALSLEYQAVITYLSATQEIIHPQGTIYSLGSFSGQNSTWKVAVAEIGMGGPSAALETERAINFFSPEILFLVGIAGGIKDVQIGDVVAATKIYNYEAGKADVHFQARPEVWRSSYALEQRARAEGRGTNWFARLNERPSGSAPRVFIGAIAAGEKVIASKQASTYQLLCTNYEDALAVEMEGHGFLQAVRANQTTRALVVRGISDLIDNKTSAERDHSQERAARHAAAFAFEVLVKFNVPDSAHDNSKHASIPSKEEPLSQISREAMKTKDTAGVRRNSCLD
jgi:nucleoside phosphorylase